MALTNKIFDGILAIDVDFEYFYSYGSFSPARFVDNSISSF